MTTLLAEQIVPTRGRIGNPWLSSPSFDTLGIANLWWPLVVLIPMLAGWDAHAGIQFWQIYFVTTPHRWITLPLLFGDSGRFRERPITYLVIAGIVVTACVTIWLATGRLTCLLAVDYLWNAWHFAAQHHGIYRAYGRRAPEVERPWIHKLEKIGLRTFLLYVVFRIANVTWPVEPLEATLRRTDWLVAALPLLLFLSVAFRGLESHRGQLVYLASVSGLYLGALFAVHTQQPGLVLLFTTASAMFHAIEYLSFVGWATARRRQAQGQRMGLMFRLAPQWGSCLMAFVLVLGAGGWLLEQHWLSLWLLLNVIVGFLHYAYDGLIWKTRR